MTLWSINQANDWWAPSVIAHLIDSGVLVPVERCEHGHYDAHQTPNVNPSIGWDDYRRCPGAGIGGEDG